MSACLNPSCRHVQPPERLLQSFAALTCLLHRGNDLPVARTTAKIPLQGSLYLCFRWMGVQGEQRLCGHDHSRCAETTLDSSLFDERLLERRRLAASASPSIVVMVAPSACTASTRQLVTERPFMMTVQAPHSPLLQPILVPRSPRSSRRTSASVLLVCVVT